MKLVLLLAFAFTLFNTGLIWTIQIVHYPGFARIGTAAYQAYQEFHMRAITMVVGPSMLLELMFSGLLIFQLPKSGLASWIIASFVLLILIWLHTAFLASPTHGKLLAGFDKTLIDRLVNINWWRTAFWSARAIILGYVLYRLL
jgi:hypothetical protein